MDVQLAFVLAQPTWIMKISDRWLGPVPSMSNFLRVFRVKKSPKISLRKALALCLQCHEEPDCLCIDIDL